MTLCLGFLDGSFSLDVLFKLSNIQYSCVEIMRALLVLNNCKWAQGNKLVNKILKLIDVLIVQNEKEFSKNLKNSTNLLQNTCQVHTHIMGTIK